MHRIVNSFRESNSLVPTFNDLPCMEAIHNTRLPSLIFLKELIILYLHHVPAMNGSKLLLMLYELNADGSVLPVAG